MSAGSSLLYGSKTRKVSLKQICALPAVKDAAVKAFPNKTSKKRDHDCEYLCIQALWRHPLILPGWIHRSHRLEHYRSLSVPRSNSDAHAEL